MGDKIRAIVFDCFGVIITDGLEAVTQRLENTNPAARSFIADTIRLNNSGLMQPAESNRRIAEHLGISVEEWVQMVSVGEVRNTELLDWIGTLRPTYRTALLSNVGQDSLKWRFSQAELDALFDVVVISAEVGIVKPDPAIYALTAEKLGVRSAECVFIDDRQVYAQAATKAGMHGIWYQGFQQLKDELVPWLRADA